MAHTVSLVAPRRQTRPVQVGSVQVGGDAPISVQSMTNTDTRDIAATLAQINAIAEAGADMVRVSCPDMESANAVKDLVAQSPIPLIADIHFDHRLALKALENGIHCLRINPGNIGSDARVREVVAAARERHVPIRIGVNAGSLEKHLLDKYREPCADAMVESALHHIRVLEDLNYPEIKISLKASDVGMTVMAYRQLATQVDYPLHLGITEAGGMRSGSVKSAIGLGLLLAEGIGDTLRVSLSADPVEEIKVGFDILKSLGLRSLGVNIISCPTCARQEFQVIDVVAQLEKRLAHIREPVSLSVIGCVVNGPGEAKETMVGVVGAQGENLMYHHGETMGKRGDEDLVESVVAQVEAIAKQMREAKEKEEAEKKL
ncbi:flavodoxin-dependent (E)-4-hydroxy-3-methylbut-2-enyl-diphosphate synthase [Magnetococcus sp. PR-3]|uniref:flavodoxin-dependent (E)-4-hydroxy-3-methylbut-2-enyl-diphosphate synthase n=1 Tax=Magnetococcus sp. PR-3 TaxID=3120355 RepID=UPI002FCE38E0